MYFIALNMYQQKYSFFYLQCCWIYFLVPREIGFRDIMEWKWQTLTLIYVTSWEVAALPLEGRIKVFILCIWSVFWCKSCLNLCKILMEIFLIILHRLNLSMSKIIEWGKDLSFEWVRASFEWGRGRIILTSSGVLSPLEDGGGYWSELMAEWVGVWVGM